MAVKTITITEKAYDALKSIKMEDESFSQLFLRITEGKKGLPMEYFGIWKDKDISSIKKRRKEIDKEANSRRKKIEEIFK